MRIVVIGCGKIGRSIAEQLAREGHELVLVDSNEERVLETQNGLDVMAICGNGASSAIQREAGVDKCDMLIACTEGDELNLLCCLIAKNLGAKRTIARVRNPEYSDEIALLREDLRLSMAFNPEFSAAQDIFSVLRFPGVMTVEKFAKGRVELAELRLPKNSPIANLSLNDINHKFKVSVLICAVRRGEATFIPNGDFVLLPDDRISFISAPEETERFLKATGLLVRRPKNVIIVGAGRIAFYLTRMLKTIGVNPTVIEKNIEKCREFSAHFPNTLVICGDGADRDLLREEGIGQADAFVSATGTDEVNILLSMYATSKNVPKVVTKISRISMLELVGEENAGSIISPRDITASQIISYVRAKENSGASNVETLYRIVDGTVEALEFVARENDPRLIGIPLKDLELKKDLLVCCIIRDGKFIIPGGNNRIQLNDRVLVVTTDLHLNDLHNILAQG